LQYIPTKTKRDDYFVNSEVTGLLFMCSGYVISVYWKQRVWTENRSYFIRCWIYTNATESDCE